MWLLKLRSFAFAVTALLEFTNASSQGAQTGGIPSLESAVDFQQALKVAQGLKLEKSAFESSQDFIDRSRFDCTRRESRLCGLVKYSPAATTFEEYDAELHVQPFYSDFTDETWNVDNEMAIDPQRSHLCISSKLRSTKESVYIGENAFGAKRRVSKSVQAAAGVAFFKTANLPMGWAGEAPSPITKYPACYDKTRYFFSKKVTQGLKIDSEDAKREQGKFILEIYGVPVAPYLVTGSIHFGATIDAPFEVDRTLTALLIKPSVMRFVGTVTHKIYETYRFPD